MEKRYILIYGQQRITSFLILLKFIKNELILLEEDLKESQKQATDNDKMESIVEKKLEIKRVVATIENTLSTSKRLEMERSSAYNSALALEADILNYLFKDKKIQNSDVKKYQIFLGKKLSVSSF